MTHFLQGTNTHNNVELSKTKIYITRGDKEKREKHRVFGNASVEQQRRVLYVIWFGFCWWCLCCSEALGRVMMMMRLYAVLTVSWPRDWGVALWGKMKITRETFIISWTNSWNILSHMLFVVHLICSLKCMKKIIKRIPIPTIKWVKEHLKYSVIAYNITLQNFWRNCLVTFPRTCKESYISVIIKKNCVKLEPILFHFLLTLNVEAQNHTKPCKISILRIRDLNWCQICQLIFFFFSGAQILEWCIQLELIKD